MVQLLVAVMIAGALAAYAAVNYQTAADKARFGVHMTNANALARAQTGYYYAASRYAADMNELAARLPLDELNLLQEDGTYATVEGYYMNKDKSAFYYFSLAEDGQSVTVGARPAVASGAGASYEVLLSSGKIFARLCNVVAGSARGKRLCKALGGEPDPDDVFYLEKGF